MEDNRLFLPTPVDSAATILCSRSWSLGSVWAIDGGDGWVMQLPAGHPPPLVLGHTCITQSGCDMHKT